MSVLCRYILIDWVVEVTLCVCVVQVHSNRLGGRSDSVSVLRRYILIDWVVEVTVCLCCAGTF